MGLFSSKKSRSRKEALKTFCGRQVRYVTRRTDDGNGPQDEIIGKNGRAAVFNGYIKVICGTTDVFVCPVQKTVINFLLSGNGATVEGENAVTGKFDRIIVYY